MYSNVFYLDATPDFWNIHLHISFVNLFSQFWHLENIKAHILYSLH